MRKRLATVLVILLLVSGAVLQLQSPGQADDPKASEDKAAFVREGQSLILALDAVSETAGEQATLVSQTERRLSQERSQVRKTEEQLKKERDRLQVLNDRVLILSGRIQELKAKRGGLREGKP